MSRAALPQVDLAARGPTLAQTHEEAAFDWDAANATGRTCGSLELREAPEDQPPQAKGSFIANLLKYHVQQQRYYESYSRPLWHSQFRWRSTFGKNGWSTLRGSASRIIDGQLLRMAQHTSTRTRRRRLGACKGRRRMVEARVRGVGLAD